MFDTTTIPDPANDDIEYVVTEPHHLEYLVGIIQRPEREGDFTYTPVHAFISATQGQIQAMKENETLTDFIVAIRNVIVKIAGQTDPDLDALLDSLNDREGVSDE